MSDSEASIRQTGWSLPVIAIWFTCIVLGSVLPRWKHLIHTRGRFHLPVHFAVFAFSGFLMFRLAPSRGGRVLSFISLIGFAFITESLERAIYRISFEWRDFVTDTLGVLIALLFIVILHAKRDACFDHAEY